MNKLKFYGVLGSLVLITSPAVAEVSGNVSLGTDYVFRGVSQTNENPTIQGGFDVSSEAGFYAGVWASNIDYDGSVEVDFYGGFAGSFNEDASYDFGVLRYEYPDDEQNGAAASSFNELYGSVAFKGLTVGLNYSPDYFSESGKATYVFVNYDLSLPNEFTASFHYGDQGIDDNAAYGTPDYADYSIGIAKTVSEIDLSLTWFDTNLSKSECFGGSDTCESRVVLAIGKTL